MVDYFKKPNLQIAIYRPLTSNTRENEFDIKMLSHWWRIIWTSRAIIHGISRALVEFDPNLKKIH